MDSIASELSVRLRPEQVEAAVEVEAPSGAPVSQRDVASDAVIVATSEASRSHLLSHTANDHQPLADGAQRSRGAERRVGEQGFGKGLISSLDRGGELQESVDGQEAEADGSGEPLVQPLVSRPEPSQFLALNLFDGNHDGLINTKDALLRYAEIGERFGRSHSSPEVTLRKLVHRTV